MTARLFTLQDLPDVQAWAHARQMVVDLWMLPEVSIIVESNGQKVAFASLYFRPLMCAIDHFTVNPEVTPESALHAFQELERFACEQAKLQGARIIQTFVEQRISSIMQRNGYFISDKPHVLATKVIV